MNNNPNVPFDPQNAPAQDAPYQPEAPQQTPYQPEAPQQTPYQPEAPQQAPYQPEAPQQAPYQPEAPQQVPYQPEAPQQAPYHPEAPQQAPYQPEAPQQAPYQAAPQPQYNPYQQPNPYNQQTPYQQPNPYNQQYNPYQQPNPYTQYNPYQQAPQPQADKSKDVVSFGEWFWTFLLMLLPVVNLVCMFVFAFGSKKENKRNCFKALLVFALICFVLALSFFFSVVIPAIYSGELWRLLAEIFGEAILGSGF